MGLFSGNKKGHVIALFDIGSGSVGGALVEMTPEGRSKILFSARENIVFQNEFRFERFLTSMLFSLEQVTKQLHAKAGHPVHDALCTLSAPWYVSQTRTVSFNSDKKILINRKKIDELVSHEVADIKKDFDAHYKDITKSTAEVIEVESVNVKLNGYETNAPFGKYARSVEAHLYVSMSSAHIVSSIREKISKGMGSKDIIFRSFSLVAFSALRDIYSNIPDFMFIDISGEMSDVSVIRQNTLVETFSFPLGKNFVIRTLASQIGTVEGDALASLQLFIENGPSDDPKEKINTVLEHAKAEWIKEFKKSLLSLSTYTVLPGKIFILTDAPFDAWFFGVVQGGDYSKLALMRDSLDVEVINREVLSKFVLFQSDAVLDIFVIIQALFVQKTALFEG